MDKETEQRLDRLRYALNLGPAKPQGLLYHYTSVEAGRNILTSQKIWFRNAKYMNDYMELEQGRRLMERWLRKTSDIREHEREYLEREFRKQYKKWKDKTYLLCFSEGDNKRKKERKRGKLSMWRGYGTGGGVAFVFDLGGVISSPVMGSPIYPVQYWKKTKFNFGMKRIIEAARWQFREQAQVKWESFLANDLLQMIYLVKHPGFREEREWRIVLRPDAALFEKLKMHQTVHGHLETILGVPLDLPNCSREEMCRDHVQCFLHLRKVIVGPSERAEDTREMFRGILRDKGFVMVDTVLSDIPYRPA